MFKAIALEPLTKIINLYIKLDPEARNRFLSLTDKIIKVELKSTGLEFYIQINRHGVAILNTCDEIVNATICATPITLIAQWQTINNKKIKLAPEMQIKGDVKLVQQLTDIFHAIEIDWEEHLSRITGDVIAHRVGNEARRINQWLRKQKENFSLNFTEYMQEELKLFPPEEEVADFIADIEVLRDDAERLSARLQRLLNLMKSPYVIN